MSRLNRAYNGPFGAKDTTYILDFQNDPAEILAAFQTYYETAELAGVTDPNIIFDIRAKLDGAGYYDDFEVERVIAAELNPKATQAMLVAAIEPVADRLLKQYKQYRAEKAQAERSGDTKAVKTASDELDALLLFKRDLATFVRIYAFLSQLFDYGTTAIEKRSIFFKRLLPLLDFGREREGIDLSKIVLTHHRLRNQGQADLPLTTNKNDDTKLKPMTEVGGGSIQSKERLLLSQIVEQVNDLFEGELSDDDKLVYVNNVLKGKLLESDLLVQQAMNNSKEQFANSPDLHPGLLNAAMDGWSAHDMMSKQVLNSTKVQEALLSILLGPGQLYEALREKGQKNIA